MAALLTPRERAAALVHVTQARQAAVLFQAHLLLPDGAGARVALDRPGDIVAVEIVAAAVVGGLDSVIATACVEAVAADRAARDVKLQALLVAAGLSAVAVETALAALAGEPRLDHHPEQDGQLPDPQPRARRRRRGLAVVSPALDHAQAQPVGAQQHTERSR